MASILVCYDFSDGDLGEKVSKLLGKKHRVQQSVFELPVDEKHMDKEIKKVIRAVESEVESEVGSEMEDGDTVRVYRLCNACEDASVNITDDGTEDI